VPYPPIWSSLTHIYTLGYGQKLPASGEFNLNSIFLVPMTTENENPCTNPVTRNGHFQLQTCWYYTILA